MNSNADILFKIKSISKAKTDEMDPFPLSPSLTLLVSPHLWPKKCWVFGTAWAYYFSDQVYWHVTAFPVTS